MSIGAETLSLPEDYQKDEIERVKEANKRISFDITGTTLQAVNVNLPEGAKFQGQVGKMSWMSDNTKMTVVTADLEGAVNRFMTGESLFLNEFSSEGGDASITLTPNLPGKIEVIKIGEETKCLISRKGAYLASESGVKTKLFIIKSVGAGFFGGLGFFLQKYEGNGNVFLEIDGELVAYELQEGQSMIIDQGILAAYEDSVNYELTTVKGLKNIFFSGEGLFLCKVSGPGKLWLQTLPAESFAKNLLFERKSPISWIIKLVFFILFILIIKTLWGFGVDYLVNSYL